MRVTLQRPPPSKLDGAVVVSLAGADDFNNFSVEVGPGINVDDIDIALRATCAGSLIKEAHTPGSP